MADIVAHISVLAIYLSDSDLITAFLQDCTLRRLSPNTNEGYKSSLRIIADLLAQNGMSIRGLDRAARALANYSVFNPNSESSIK